ncbi:MAG: 2-amino-4-hydroxy-6-hydroxymethyldihydropteridine diphosphokinase [Novosphingobium sp.]
MAHRYLIALGSNQRHPRFGDPRKVLAAALKEMQGKGLSLLTVSPVYVSAPVGPSLRRYANGAALIETALDPEALLAHLQAIEARFGRKRRGQPWRARVLDLDIVLWSRGAFAAPRLTLPHVQFRHRAFVLQPAQTIAADWRDPISGFTIRQLHSRLTRPRPVP